MQPLQATFAAAKVNRQAAAIYPNTKGSCNSNYKLTSPILKPMAEVLGVCVTPGQQFPLDASYQNASSKPLAHPQSINQSISESSKQLGKGSLHILAELTWHLVRMCVCCQLSFNTS
jgi:hypothetical protein